MSAERAALLKSHFESKDQGLRPILTSINGDNSWLISFPRPAAERASSRKAFFHVVSDPWLVGDSYFGPRLSWLLTIKLRRQSPFLDGDAVESLIKDIEDLASASDLVVGGGSGNAATQDSPLLDAIFINFHYVDHLHEQTLRTIDARVPVFASPEAGPMIDKFNHFRSITITSDLKAGDGIWRELHPAGLPDWLSVFRIVGHHELNFATAFVWSPSPDQHECILYSPHGILTTQPTYQTFLHELQPQIKTTAMLFSLNGSLFASSPTKLGVDGALLCERDLEPKYWIRTHDSVFTYSGLFSYAIRELPRTIESALQAEKASGKLSENAGTQRLPNYVEVDPGASFLVR
ncbi:hypothetical protein BX600DRAFT_518419 [Xylariales sp. PMI_506]|nr:hypothetical protein BX600DRAFT_518419 [Xylariales sp. PMI_506]